VQRPSANQLIWMDRVSKIYQLEAIETHAVSEVSLEVAAGEFVVICGPSGSGKTTLISLIGLLDQPTAGQYRLNGVGVEGTTPEERARIRNRDIGFVFQSFNLINDLTVYENVELPLWYRGVSVRERRERTLAALERVDMLSRVRHYPAQLSGGQQQRAAVARAIVGDPLLVLADEPTGNLDSRNAENIMDLLAGLNQSGSTIIMVTHEPRYASYAHLTVHMMDGRKAREERGEPQRTLASVVSR
jgi:putative ABC transport system ATP-binding protein